MNEKREVRAIVSVAVLDDDHCSQLCQWFQWFKIEYWCVLFNIDLIVEHQDVPTNLPQFKYRRCKHCKRRELKPNEVRGGVGDPSDTRRIR